MTRALFRTSVTIDDLIYNVRSGKYRPSVTPDGFSCHATCSIDALPSDEHGQTRWLEVAAAALIAAADHREGEQTINSGEEPAQHAGQSIADRMAAGDLVLASYARDRRVHHAGVAPRLPWGGEDTSAIAAGALILYDRAVRSRALTRTATPPAS
jgi:hypothetical protein